MQLEAGEFARLPGEEQSGARDAEHWIRVYGELIEFCELMLTRPEMSAEAHHIHRRLSHYRSRLSHWQGQREEAP